MANITWLRAVALGAGTLLLVSGAAKAQDDSIAAAASASRKAAASAHKVYSDDDLTTLRHKDHAPDAALAANCNADCQDKVKALLESIAPGKWQPDFDAGMAATRDDDSWQELFARVRAQNCADKQTKKSPEESNPTLLTDLRAKISEERSELNDLRREAMGLPPNSPDRNDKLNLIRVRSIKLAIMGVELTGLSSDPCTPPAAAKAAPAQQ